MGKWNKMDNNIHGTNLAEAGTDCISRQAAIDAINEIIRMEHSLRPKVYVAKDAIKALPSIQPERKECEEREQGKCPWYAG